MAKLVRFWIAAAIAFLSIGAAFAADPFPNKPIRIISPFPPGGPIDVQARIIANVMQTRLNVPVVVENRPGANQLVGVNSVAQAPADGYTLIYFVPALSTSVFVKSPQVDVLKAFTPIGSTWIGPLVLATTNEVPGKSLADFVAHVKKSPGKFNYANTTGATNMAMEAFMQVAGLEMQKIEYKGTVQAITALMSNEVQAFFGGAQVLISQARAGKVRLLGVGGTQRLPGAPDLPTFAELGYPSIRTSITTMLMAPAGVPKEVIAKLAPLVKEAVASDEMQRNLRDNGVPFSAEPEQLTKFITDEILFWSDMAKATKFTPQY
ncbi:MAG TPA: tripartite tricarboxylate transporter substrate binding protein [Ramlibacter sp.]|nr:tripartite tricarboxylate transporter substrate binding protein [Ramlibacter sp.]